MKGGVRAEQICGESGDVAHQRRETGGADGRLRRAIVGRGGCPSSCIAKVSGVEDQDTTATRALIAMYCAKHHPLYALAPH